MFLIAFFSKLNIIILDLRFCEVGNDFVNASLQASSLATAFNVQVHCCCLKARVVEVSLSFVSILLFSSFLVTPCVLVPYWLAWSELSVKKVKESITL